MSRLLTKKSNEASPQKSPKTAVSAPMSLERLAMTSVAHLRLAARNISDPQIKRQIAAHCVRVVASVQASGKTAEIGSHSSPKVLPPRMDQRSYLDEEVKNEVAPQGVNEPTPITAPVPRKASLLVRVPKAKTHV